MEGGLHFARMEPFFILEEGIVVMSEGKPPIADAFLQGGTFQSIPQDAILANAKKALETARRILNFLSSGGAWISRGPAGEVMIKAALVYDRIVVGALEFSPIDGELLPRGYHPRVLDVKVSLEEIEKKAEDIVKGLEILGGAEYREPELSWVVPLAYDGKVVSHIKVYYDGVHIVPDYPLMQEMMANKP